MTAARRRASADWDAVKQKYPSTQFGEKEWLAVFDANPDIAFRVIGDICKAVVATEADVRRTGRRPSSSTWACTTSSASCLPGTRWSPSQWPSSS
jgi:hypothetical protein